jgi:hypothetical protein
LADNYWHTAHIPCSTLVHEGLFAPRSFFSPHPAFPPCHVPRPTTNVNKTCNRPRLENNGRRSFLSERKNKPCWLFFFFKPAFGFSSFRVHGERRTRGPVFSFSIQYFKFSKSHLQNSWYNYKWSSQPIHHSPVGLYCPPSLLPGWALDFLASFDGTDS